MKTTYERSWSGGNLAGRKQLMGWWASRDGEQAYGETKARALRNLEAKLEAKRVLSSHP